MGSSVIKYPYGIIDGLAHSNNLYDEFLNSATNIVWDARKEANAIACQNLEHMTGFIWC